MDKHIYDSIIIGAGPAGLGAAIYAARAGFDVLLVEKSYIYGGQIVNTSEVDNYLGLPGIGGFELGMEFTKHVDTMNVNRVTDEITGLALEEDIKVVIGNNDTYYAKTVILAMGAHHSRLGVSGEAEYIGRGVSFCATCDGAFFRNKQVIVVGGGDVAVEDASFLANICDKVILIHRRGTLRAARLMQKRLLEKENVSVMYNCVLKEISGNEAVTKAVVTNLLTDSDTTLEVSGVFIAVGMEPETQICDGIVEMDDKGYIVAGEDCRTSIPGIFAVGDIRTKKLRQVITAVADGACAVNSAGEYLT